MRRMADVFLELGVLTLKKKKKKMKLTASLIFINRKRCLCIYFPVMLLTMLHKVVPSFEFAD